MKKIYGGLFLENIVRQDEFFDLQCQLFNAGLIQGAQIRVAHPDFTLGVSSHGILDKLPKRFKIFIHIGAENVGVDFGKCFDERGFFTEKGKMISIPWWLWNDQTVKWGIIISTVAGLKKPYGVVHPGYCTNNQRNNWETIISKIKSIGSESLLLENVPPLVIKSLFPTEKTQNWKDFYWGVGGTPEQMKRLLEMTSQVDQKSQCLIDFTHVAVAESQIKAGYIPGPNTLAKLIQGFLDLPHSKTCHFSGVPTGLIDEHTDLSEPVSPEIIEAMQEMQTVCLEIPWHKMTFDEAKAAIERFRDKYKFY